LDLVKWT